MLIFSFQKENPSFLGNIGNYKLFTAELHNIPHRLVNASLQIDEKYE